MKKIFLLTVLLLLPFTGALAAGGGVHLDEANVDVSNKASLQRGARDFINYCMGCHSAAYMRYNRMGRDLGLSDQQVLENMVFTDSKLGDTMDIAMRTADAKKWFWGAGAPDLSVIARARGADWLYTYLRSFYRAPERPSGVNNAVKEVTMPHVLWELQGWQDPVYEENEKGEKKIASLKLAEPGSQSPREFDRTVRDIVTFLVYLAEPAQLQRKQMGFWVLLFLALLFVVTYAMKKEYWKDIH